MAESKIKKFVELVKSGVDCDDAREQTGIKETTARTQMYKLGLIKLKRNGAKKATEVKAAAEDEDEDELEVEVEEEDEE